MLYLYSIPFRRRQNLQLATLLFPQIRHHHDLHHKTCPPGEMLGPLSFARFGIVLLPGESRAFPLIEDVLDEVFPKRFVHFCSLGFMRTSCSGHILMKWEIRLTIEVKRGQRGGRGEGIPEGS